MPNDDCNPKLFLSYSWSTPEHEQWVIDLATQLAQSGIHVIFDKWDLREGQDSLTFMERMVSDPTVTKVLMISDRVYAEKANDRAGGVGTETQIISKEVYDSQDQRKFVAAVPEKGPDGKAYLPIYYGARIYIDFSDSSKYSEKFEELLRWVFDKPRYVRPEMGNRPAFLDENRVRLGTEASFMRCLDAVRTAKPFASGATDEFLSEFIANLERFCIEPQDGFEIDDQVVERIDYFLPYRNQIIQLTTAIAQYAATDDYVNKLHRFLESLLPYMERPPHLTQWNELQFDNYKFLGHELFIYVIAILIDREHFELANQLLARPYFIAGRSEYGRNATVDFRTFRQYAKSFPYRNQRLNAQRTSIRADMLKQRSETSGVDFQAVMQGEFVAFLRSFESRDENGGWWPETLLYSLNSYGPFEKFARSTSRTYFDRFKIAIGVKSLEELQSLFEFFGGNRDLLPKWGFDRLDVTTLAGAKNLCKVP